MNHRVESFAILFTTMVAAALVFGDFDTPLRPIFAIGFVAVAPGLAIAQLIGITGLAIRLFLAIPISLAISTLVAGAMTYAGITSWNFGLTIIMSLAIGAVILDIGRSGIVHAAARRATARRLTDEDRQERLISSLRQGSTLAEAARAAGVSQTTVHRELRRSDSLRRAVEVASGGLLTFELDGDELRETRRQGRGDPQGESG